MDTERTANYAKGVAVSIIASVETKAEAVMLSSLIHFYVMDARVGGPVEPPVLDSGDPGSSTALSSGKAEENHGKKDSGRDERTGVDAVQPPYAIIPKFGAAAAAKTHGGIARGSRKSVKPRGSKKGVEGTRREETPPEPFVTRGTVVVREGGMIRCRSCEADVYYFTKAWGSSNWMSQLLDVVRPTSDKIPALTPDTSLLTTKYGWSVDCPLCRGKQTLVLVPGEGQESTSEQLPDFTKSSAPVLPGTGSYVKEGGTD